MSKIFCDSCCELFERADELGIEIIKIPYFLDGVQVKQDGGAGFDATTFYTKMKEGAVATSTSALNPQEYAEIFEPVLKAGEDILYFGFSNEMSGTFNQMDTSIKELQKKYPERKITTIDTKQMSLGCGFIVWFSALQHKQGMSDEDIVKFANTLGAKICTYATVEDLKYLKKGGRISGLTAFVGGMLNIKPIMKMVDGKLIKTDKVRGRKSSLKALLDTLATDGVDTSYPIGVVSALCEDDMKEFVSDIKTKYPSANIWQQQIGPVIGAHAGPGTVAIFFVAK